MATHMWIGKQEKPEGVIILQVCTELKNNVLLVELESFTLDSIYNSVNTLHNMSNEFKWFKEFAGHSGLKSVYYSGKQRQSVMGDT